MSKQFRPLKAVNKDIPFEDFLYPMAASIKMDGVYSIVKSGQLLGRSLKPFKNKYITNILSKGVFEGFVGEICNASELYGEFGLNRNSLCRDTTSCTNTVDKDGWPFYWVLFDNVGDSNDDMCASGFIRRFSLLHDKLYQLSNRHLPKVELLGDIAYHHYIVEGVDILIPVIFIVENAEDAEDLYLTFVEDGFEGGVYRKTDGVFKFGRSTEKSQEIVRKKPLGRSEIIVTSFEPMFENNNEAKLNELGYTERSSHKDNKVQLDMVGALIGIDINTGETVKIGAGKLSHAEREAVWLNQGDYIGRLANYLYMDFGVKDAPRHPRFNMWRPLSDVDQDVVINIAKEKGVYINVDSY